MYELQDEEYQGWRCLETKSWLSEPSSINTSFHTSWEEKEDD